MTTKDPRGGPRTPGPGKRIGRPSGPTGGPYAEQIQVRFYPEDFANVRRLIALNYGEDRTKVIRRALQEVVKRLT